MLDEVAGRLACRFSQIERNDVFMFAVENKNKLTMSKELAFRVSTGKNSRPAAEICVDRDALLPSALQHFLT